MIQKLAHNLFQCVQVIDDGAVEADFPAAAAVGQRDHDGILVTFRPTYCLICFMCLSPFWGLGFAATPMRIGPLLLEQPASPGTSTLPSSCALHAAIISRPDNNVGGTHIRW
jgi:hypothetical protein